MNVDKTIMRDPDRSRESILDAAEYLFATKGYEETSLQEIGQQAGVSRGTPNYFFGTKEQLYGAVLDRVMLAEHEAIARMQSQTATGDSSPEAIFAQGISDYLDFLLTHPHFIHLLEREALNNARFLHERSAYLAVLKEGLGLMQAGVTLANVRPVDPMQLLLSIIALCWFPIAHEQTFLHPLGIETGDTAFWESRKQHIIDLILHGIIVSHTTYWDGV
jgi:TetR/AcrR family transcriptional regulator